VEKLPTVHILPAMSKLDAESGEERAHGATGPSEEGYPLPEFELVLMHRCGPGD
jgi:hypothetical protein